MDMWNKAPFIRLIIPFIAGIVLGVEFDLPNSIHWGLIAVCSLFLLFSALYGGGVFQGFRTGRAGLIVLPFMVSAGWFLTDSSEDIRHPSHFSHQYQAEDLVVVRVLDPPEPRERTVKMLTEVTYVLKDSTDKYPADGKLLVYLQQSDSLELPEYGDVLLLSGEIKEVPPPSNPSQFNYKRHLKNKHIHHQVFVQTDHWKNLGTGNRNPIYTAAYKLRFGLLGMIEERIDGERNVAVASALLLGYKEKLDRDVLLTYGSAGAMHVLAVSGLHVGIIYLVLHYMFYYMQRGRRRWLRTILIIACLWIYALLTGMSPSVMRSATMFTFIVLGQGLGRNTNVYNTLSASAFFLLCLNPYMLTEVGFQLSYIAVLGIVIFQPRLYGMLYVRNWLLDKVWAITCVSIAAQLATFPLGIYYFHQFPNYFLVSNLFVIPMASIILYSGFLFFLVGGLIPDLFWLSGWVLDHSIRLLNSVVSIIEELPNSLIYGISISLPELLFLYLILGSLIVFMFIRRGIWLITAMVITCGLLAYQWQQVTVHNEQRILAVYDIRNTSAINVIQGRNNVLIAHEDLLVDEDQILFNIRHFWFDRRTEQEVLIPIGHDTVVDNLYLTNNLLQFGEHRLLRIDDSLSNMLPSGNLEVDFVIVSEDPWIDLAALKERVAFKRIILDASNKPWIADKIAAKCDSLDIPRWNVQEQGAFVYFY